MAYVRGICFAYMGDGGGQNYSHLLLPSLQVGMNGDTFL